MSVAFARCRSMVKLPRLARAEGLPPVTNIPAALPTSTTCTTTRGTPTARLGGFSL